jgi:glycine cleavage system aminomethyltransferase T
LAGLLITTNIVPPVGSEVLHHTEQRGIVGSVGESLALRAPVALAMVRREVNDGDQVQLRWDGGTAPATVRPLPLHDFSSGPHKTLTSGADAVGDSTGATT